MFHIFDKLLKTISLQIFHVSLHEENKAKTHGGGQGIQTREKKTYRIRRR